MQKLDPYINVDPGTMSPYQHGEVYVLDDGSETDLDLGHYERFTNSPLNRDSNYTTGQIYLSVINKERRGEFLGQTVQVIPHITNEIKAALAKLAGPDVDVVITEIGGTVGDIESQPFLEAIRQFSLDVGKENCLYIHLTLVPYLKAADELKTKPTQHSVGQLRQIGIQPDILICRTVRTLSHDERKKIALFCNVPVEAVIEEKDKDFSIYEVPLSLVEHGLDELIVRKLGLKAGRAEPGQVARPAAPAPQSRARDHHRRGGQVRRAPRRLQVDLRGPGPRRRGPPGPGPHPADPQRGGRARRARAAALRRRRHAGARRLRRAGHRGQGRGHPLRPRREASPSSASAWACSAPWSSSPATCSAWSGPTRPSSTRTIPHPVICLLDEQKDDHRQGRHDASGGPAGQAGPGSRAAAAYGTEQISERHRHRYEFNNAYRQQFEAGGHVHRGHQPRRLAGGDRRDCRAIPGSWPCSSIRSSSRSRRGRIRCSPGFIGAAVEHRRTRADGR